MAVSEEDILYLSSQLEARLSAIQRENAMVLSKLKDYKVAHREGHRVNRHLYRRLMCTPLQEGRKNGGGSGGGGARTRGGGASSRGRSRGAASGKRAGTQRKTEDEEGESEAASRRRLMAQQRRLWKQRQQQQQQRQQEEEEEEAMLQQHAVEMKQAQPQTQQQPQQQQPQPLPQPQPKPQLQQQQQPRSAVVQLTGVQVVAAPVAMTVPHVVLQIPAAQPAVKSLVAPPALSTSAAQPPAQPAPPAAPATPSTLAAAAAQPVSSSTAKQRLEAAFKAFAKRTGPAIQQDLARSGGGALNQRTLAQELVKRWGQLSDTERKSYFAPL